MMRLFLRCRIHNAVITALEPGGDGSLRMDEHLMNAADLMPFERVQVHTLTGAEQFETWVLPAPPGGGELRVSGAPARRCRPGERVTISAFGALHAGQILDHKPRLIQVDERNRATTVAETATTTAPPGGAAGG